MGNQCGRLDINVHLNNPLPNQQQLARCKLQNLLLRTLCTFSDDRLRAIKSDASHGIIIPRTCMQFQSIPKGFENVSGMLNTGSAMALILA